MGTLIDINNLNLSVGTSVLLDSVDARLVRGHSVALCGSNGAGKSTFLRALASPENSSYYTVGAGGIKWASNLTHESIIFVEQDKKQWSKLLGGSDESELLELPLPDALDLASALGGIELEAVDSWRELCVAASESLGWSTALYDTTPLGKLSPGCAARAYLAIALQRLGIDVLLLDEPTNHIDLPSIFWLRSTIRTSGKTVIIVSHDAAFLDDVCDHVWSIDSKTKNISVSGASYSDFRRAQQLALEQQAAAYEIQGRRNQKLTAVANKMRTESTKGQFKVAKDNDKLQRDFRRDRAGRSGKKAKAVEALRDSQEKVERVVIRPPLKLDIVPIGAGSDGSIVLSEVVLGYNDEALATPPISMRIDFGECIAFIGHNGVGKSTLLRVITRAIVPLSGDVSVGRELRIGNLTQEHSTLPRERTLREHFAEVTGKPLFNVGNRLIRYGVTLQQVDNPIEELNPGARARAILGGFAMRNVNMLVLDEVTNHLDEEAVREVEATIREFDGTVVVVSHDVEFLLSLKKARYFSFSKEGIIEIESLEKYVEDIEDNVASVMEKLG